MHAHVISREPGPNAPLYNHEPNHCNDIALVSLAPMARSLHRSPPATVRILTTTFLARLPSSKLKRVRLLSGLLIRRLGVLEQVLVDG